MAKNNVFIQARKDLKSKTKFKIRTRQSTKWFAQQLRNATKDRKKVLKDVALKPSEVPLPGSMMFFRYDAKGKRTLPYWDRFPIIVIVSPAPNGFYGLNMHYLPPILRIEFMDAYLQFAAKENVKTSFLRKLFTRHSRHRLKDKAAFVKAVSKHKLFEPTLHHYLFKHVTTKFYMLKDDEWEIAAFLPVQHWDTKTRSSITADEVYADSIRIMKRSKKNPYYEAWQKEEKKKKETVN